MSIIFLLNLCLSIYQSYVAKEVLVLMLWILVELNILQYVSVLGTL